MFNWRDYSGRNAQLAWLRIEKQRELNLVQKTCTTNNLLPTTSSTNYLTTEERKDGYAK